MPRQPPSLGLSVSSLPEPHYLVGDSGDNGLRAEDAACAGTLQLSGRHGTAGALQRRCRLIRLHFSSDFLSPKMESFFSERCGVSKPLLPQPVPAAGAGGQGSGYVLQPKVPGCPPGRAKKVSAISEPNLEFTVKKTLWQRLGGYF